MLESQTFDVESFAKHLTTKHMGRKVIYEFTTETTMDDALQLGKSGALHGTLVLAEDQTKARGYKGHSFNATNVGNIYASLVLHRPLEEKYKGYSGSFNPEIGTALAARAAVEEMGVHSVKIKWPNDLWVRGHKLGGFLVEASDYVIPDTNSAPPLGLFILGIGLNVNSDIRRDPSLAAIATSVACELDGHPVDREKLLATLCNQLEVNLQKSQKELFEEFLRHSLFKPGDPILVHEEFGKTHEAEIIEIKETWRVLVKCSDDSQHEYSSSELVSLRPKPCQSVLVACRDDVMENACNKMYSLIHSLVDNVSTAIEYIQITELVRGHFPSDARILVVDKDVHSVDVQWVKSMAERVRSFITDGGGVLCIDTATEFAEIWFPELGLKVNPVKSNTKDALNLVLSTDTASTSEKVIYGFPNNGQSKCFDVSPEEIVIARYSHDNTPAIISRHFGKGTICLCGIHIEDLVSSQSSVLDKELFKRDILVQNMLQTCGLKTLL